ncbi:MAG: hypothetical protein V8Q84_03145 [Bilophila sp.]
MPDRCRTTLPPEPTSGCPSSRARNSICSSAWPISSSRTAWLLLRTGLDAFKALVAPWTPEKACQATGLMPDRFKAVVEGLKKAEKPLVIVGSDMDAGGGTGPMRLGMAINMLLDRVNKPGGMRLIPTAPAVVQGGGTYEQLMEGDIRRIRRCNGQGHDA